MDNNQQLVPSPMFLTHILVLAKRAKAETGVGLIEFLSSFNANTEAELIAAIRKYLEDRHPDFSDKKS